MANSVFKLKVETSEYDANIKKAAEGIQHLASVAHKAGGELTGLDKAEIDYLKTLGDMPTMSHNAASATRELEKAYKELTVVYNNLNDVEKADEGGKALAASLDKLRQRAQESRQHLDAATQSLQNNGQAGKESSSILDKLASKFTINIDAIKLFKGGLNAAEGALNVAKDAFFASEATVDEWGRTMEASKSVYQGFLNALNTGDISGYLDNINDIVNAARTAYNELDRLRTMKRIQTPQISSRQAENDRLRMMIQSGRYIAPIDGRKATMQNGQILTPEQIRVLERQLQSGMQHMVTLVGNEVKQSTKAINAVYDKQAKELGLTQKEFRKGTSSMEEFDKRIQGYQDYRAFERQHTIYDDRTGIGHRDNAVNPYEAYKAWGVFRVDGDKYGQLVQLIQQRDQQMGQAYGMQSQAYRAINKVEGITPHKIVGGGGTGGGGITPQQRAQESFTKAEQNYKQALEQAAMELEAGTITRAEAKKKEMQAAEQRWKAIGDARNINDSENLRKAQDEAADEYKRLAAEVKTITEHQKALDKATRDLEQANQKLATARTEMAQAKQQGDLQAYNTAKDKATAAQKEVTRLEKVKVNVETGTVNLPDIPTEMTQKVDFQANTRNIDAAISYVKKEMDTIPVGTIAFNLDQTKLADLTTLKTLITEQVKNGLQIDPNFAQSMFSNILTGKDIENTTWQAQVDNINKNRTTNGRTPLKINYKTGEKEGKNEDDQKKTSEEQLQGIQTMIGSLQSIVGGINQLGIELPQELTNIFGVLQTITGIVGAIQSMQTIGTFLGIFHNGGLIGRAAGGMMIPGNSMSGDRLRLPVDGGRGMIGVNSGELVLNRAQQGNLASQLQGGGQMSNGTPYITGELIYLGLNNYLKSTGRGEMMTSRFKG